MGKGEPTYIDAPIDLYSHIDERSVRFKKHIESVEANKVPVVRKIKCFRMGTVSFMLLLAHFRTAVVSRHGYHQERRLPCDLMRRFV